MRDWDTRINTLKSDIQAAREKYVIPFMKSQPKPAPPQKEVSQTPSDNLEENINIKTKRLAKKQITWFKKESKLNMIETDDEDHVYNAMMEIIND